MASRKPLIAANWKMNAPPVGWDGENSAYKPQEATDVIVFPSLLDIHICLEKFLMVGGQYGHPEPKGAYTGDVSMQLLAQHGCTWVLCGHSERRKHHAETDDFIAMQVTAALDAGLHPIVCVGETAEERTAGNAKHVVERQLLTLKDNSDIAIAYEPVWAIGNGNTITAGDAQEMHAFIRSLLPKKHQDTIRILYGGSVKPENAKELIEQEDVDGFLIGSSSLDPAAFGKIIEIASLNTR